jgi:hypothetical protein
MKLEEAMEQVKSVAPPGYRVGWYRSDGRFEMTPDKAEPPIRRRRQATELARGLAATGNGYTDICVIDNQTHRTVGIVLNPVRTLAK